MIKLKDVSSLEENDTVSLPIGYYVEGYFKQEPEIGKPVILFRTNRNGVNFLGLTETSEVTEILEDGFKTKNSIYKIEHLHEKDKD